MLNGCRHFLFFFAIERGVRQGGVLSPQLFSVYIDEVVKIIEAQRIGCHIGVNCVSTILYADDILLLAPSVECLQRLLLLCEAELQAWDLLINDRKTVCMRVGPRYLVKCAVILTLCGKPLQWVQRISYLGVNIISAREFCCCFDDIKKSFYRSFNSIFGRVGRRAASEEVILSLIKSKCLPILLYGVEAIPISKSNKQSLEFTVTRLLMKIFRSSSNEVIEYCRVFFMFSTVSELITRRKINFLRKFKVMDNSLCNLFVTAANIELLTYTAGD